MVLIVNAMVAILALKKKVILGATVFDQGCIKHFKVFVHKFMEI